MRHFVFIYLELILQLACFLICVLLFGDFAVCLFSVAFGFLDVARFRFGSYFFDRLGICPFDSVLTSFGDTFFYSCLFPVCLFNDRTSSVFKFAYAPVPSLWKDIPNSCVPLCDSLPACVQYFLFSFVLHKETMLLTHYLHSSHLDLSLRRCSLRVGSFFFVPLL